MKKKDYEELHEQSREYVCEKHGVPKMDTRIGGVYCPFCEREEWLSSVSQQVDSWGINSVNEFRYCPICGLEVKSKEVHVSKYKTNLKVVCPNHGELYIRKT